MPVEEQTANNQSLTMTGLNSPYVGQRLTIPNRVVTKLSFLIGKANSPVGSVSFRILKVSDDSVILDKLWGLAADLQTDPVWEEVEFDTPALINEEVRLLVYYPDGEGTNSANPRWQGSDVKADEYKTRNEPGAWNDEEWADFTYRYTYEEPSPPVVAVEGSPAAQLISAGLI